MTTESLASTTEPAAAEQYLSLTMERTFQAPVERVFDAFTSAEVLARWFRGAPDWPEASADVDLRVGGTVRVVMSKPDASTNPTGSGVYTEIDRPTRLAYTWTWDNDPRETLVEVDFEPTGDATKIHFTHSRLVSEESVADHTKGWTSCFDHLVVALQD